MKSMHRETRQRWMAAATAVCLAFALGTGNGAAMPAMADASEPDTKAGAAEVGTTFDNFGLKVNVPVAPGELVRIGSSVEVKSGEKYREVVVIFGNAVIDGDVEREAVCVGGDVRVNGRVGGDFVTVLGSASLGPNAKLGGDCVVVGGRLDRDPAAQLVHEPVEVNFGGLFAALKPVGQWFRSGLLLGRPFPPGMSLAWWIAGLHFLVYIILFLLLPRPVQACEKALDQRLLACFLVGLLALILLGPALFILVASGVGLLILPFILMAIVAAQFVGKTAVFSFWGSAVVRRFNPAGEVKPLAAFLIGSVLVTLLYMVPVVGFLVWGLLIPVALGAACLATASAYRQNGAPSAPPVPVALHGGGTAAVAPGVPGEPGALPAPEGAAPMAPEGAPAGAAPAGPASGGARPMMSDTEMALLPRVGFWLRLGASALDFLLWCWAVPTLDGFFVVVWLAYHAVMWAWKGTTVGGIICGIRVVRLDGRPVDASVAVVRSLSGLLSFMALCLGFFWASWFPERQSWHDKVAGTTVVKLPKGTPLI